MKLENILIGTDVEYAVVKDGNIVSGIGYVGGEKHSPLILDEEYGLTRTEDNVLFEAQCPPVQSLEDWIFINRRMREKGNELLSQYGMSLLAMSSHIYPDSELEHPKAREFGCSASQCAWTEDTMYTCGPEEAGNLRSSGFHAHIGTTSDITEKDFYDLMKCCDVFLGVPSVLIDLDTERRKLYGKAGECRIRVIGEYIVMEYRTLGGNMLASDELIAWVYTNLMKAIEYFETGDMGLIEDLGEVIENTINTCDVNKALELCNIFDVDYPKIQVDKENFVYQQQYETV